MLFHDLDSQSEYLVFGNTYCFFLWGGDCSSRGVMFLHFFLAYVQKSSYVSSIFKRFAEYLLHVIFLV